MDLIHAADEEHNIITSTAQAAASIDVRIAISEDVQRRLLQKGVPEERIRLIRNGIDVARFVPACQRNEGGVPRILFAGRLDPVKRPLLLVELARELRKRRQDFRLVVAGDGPEARLLAQRVHESQLDPVFELLGHVADIAPELANCDVVVILSKTEGIPLILLEAFASQKPVVAPAVGGIPEVLNEHNGFLIPPGNHDVQRFADAIDMLLRQPELRRNMGENGRRLVVSKFNQESSRAAYRSLFA
jgi:glycosyltransferase involved in cell wall biosynthesis